jgi:hypothetical protein
MTGDAHRGGEDGRRQASPEIPATGPGGPGTVARWNDAPTSGFYVLTRWSVMYRPCVHSGRGATSPRHCRAGLVPDAGRTESFWRTTTCRAIWKPRLECDSRRDPAFRLGASVQGGTVCRSFPASTAPAVDHGFLSHLRSLKSYDEPKILPTSTHPICLMSADLMTGRIERRRHTDECSSRTHCRGGPATQRHRRDKECIVIFVDHR